MLLECQTSDVQGGTVTLTKVGTTPNAGGFAARLAAGTKGKAALRRLWTRSNGTQVVELRSTDGRRLLVAVAKDGLNGLLAGSDGQVLRVLEDTNYGELLAVISEWGRDGNAW